MSVKQQMKGQQEYFSQVEQILAVQQKITLTELMMRVLSVKLSQEEIQRRLNKFQKDYNDVDKDGWRNEVGDRIDLSKVRARELSVKEVVKMIGEIEAMYKQVVQFKDEQKRNFQFAQLQENQSSSPLNQQQQQSTKLPYNRSHNQHTSPILLNQFAPQTLQQKHTRIKQFQNQKQEQKQNQYQNQGENNIGNHNYQQEEFEHYNHNNEEGEQNKEDEEYKGEDKKKFNPFNQQQTQQQHLQTLEKQKLINPQQLPKKHQLKKENIKAKIHLPPNKKSIPPTKNNPTPQPTSYKIIKQKIMSFLVLAYYQYVIEQYSATNKIFDKSSIFKKPLMQLTLFLKFYKDFEIKPFYKVNQVIKLFKKQALNHLWIDATILMKLCYYVIQNKFDDDTQKESAKIVDQKELVDRANKFLKLFDKIKVKNFLKFTTKEKWNAIVEQYHQRNQPQKTVEKTLQNKGQVVGKFLQRNFEQQVPKWVQKKQNPPQSKSQIKAVSKVSNDKKRDEKSISNSIIKLRTKSEKNLNKLKNLLNKNSNNDLQQLINKKSDQKSPKVVKQIPLSKNKQKNTISVYKEIEKYLNDNSKLMKSQKNTLSKELKVLDDEPFLSAYFKSELKIEKQKTSNQKGKGKSNININLTVPDKEKKNGIKSSQKKEINSPQKILPFVKSEQSKAPSGYELVTPYSKMNLYKDISSQQNSSIKKSNSISEPTLNHLKNKVPQCQRVYSMKKLASPNAKNNHPKWNQSNQVDSMKSGGSRKKMIGKVSKLSEQEKQLVNKKLYQFLANNKEQRLSINIQGVQKNVNDKLPKKLQKSSSKINTNPTTRSPSVSPNKILLQSESPLPQNKLMQEFQQQVYELWKNFQPRGQEENQIVVFENQKRKGYFKEAIPLNKRK